MFPGKDRELWLQARKGQEQVHEERYIRSLLSLMVVSDKAATRTAILLVAPIAAVVVMVTEVSPRDTRAIGTLEHAAAAPLGCQGRGRGKEHRVEG